MKKEQIKKTFRLKKEVVNYLEEIVEKENNIRSISEQGLTNQTEILERIIVNYYNHTYQGDLIAEAKNNEREFMTNIISNIFDNYFGSLSKQIEHSTDMLRVMAAFFNIANLYKYSEEHQQRIYKNLDLEPILIKTLNDYRMLKNEEDNDEDGE